MTYASSQARTILDRTIAKGVTIKTIAEKSDVSIRTVSRLRNGHAVSELSALAVMSGLGVIWVERRESKNAESQTPLEAVEQLAAQRVNADLTHHADWDADLECAKYRRVIALEKELEQTQDVLAQREQHLKSCENALIEADQKLNDANTAWVSLNTQHSTTTQRLNDANAEIKRLDELAKGNADNWRKVCAKNTELQKQLADNRENYQKLYDYSFQQDKDEAEMLAQIDTLFAERDNMRTEYECGLVRLRVRCFALVCAIVFLIVSGLVVWGAV